MNKIALLNDAFRRTFSGGKITMTAGVYALLNPAPRLLSQFANP
jgi:hypothetical protein